MSRQLEGKHAVIYGAGGSVGGAVARAFAVNGARLSLVGRTAGPLEATAASARAAGADVSTESLDVFHSAAVEDHAGRVWDEWGPIDISFNLTGANDYVGTPILEVGVTAFTAAVAKAVSSNFATARAAAALMAQRGSGVVLMFTATPARANVALCGAFGVIGAGLEALTRTMGAELGPQGVRFVCLRSAGSPDSTGLTAAFTTQAEVLGTTAEAMRERAEAEVPLRQLPSLAAVADAAVFAASDAARALTATTINITSGVTVD